MTDAEAGAMTREKTELVVGQTPLTPRVRPTAREVFDFRDRPARVVRYTSVLEWIGFVLAILVPPLGLLVTVIARVVTRYRRHWTTPLARAATVISIVLTLLLGVGGVVYSSFAAKDADAARVVAEAQPLCAALAETPGVLDLDAYGWPTEVASLDNTLVAMQAYQAKWQQVAELAPAAQKSGTTAIADQAAILVAAVQSTRAINRAGNLAAMKSVTDASGLPQFAATYCAP